MHFHDSRAEAIWRLSKKLDILQLARITEHRDLKSLMLYYHEPASEIARSWGDDHIPSGLPGAGKQPDTQLDRYGCAEMEVARRCHQGKSVYLDWVPNQCLSLIHI